MILRFCSGLSGDTFRIAAATFRAIPSNGCPTNSTRSCRRLFVGCRRCRSNVSASRPFSNLRRCRPARFGSDANYGRRCGNPCPCRCCASCGYRCARDVGRGAAAGCRDDRACGEVCGDRDCDGSRGVAPHGLGMYASILAVDVLVAAVVKPRVAHVDHHLIEFVEVARIACGEPVGLRSIVRGCSSGTARGRRRNRS